MDILPPIQTQPQDTTCWCHTHCVSQENHFVQASWLEAGWDRWHKISQRPRFAQTHSLPDWSSLDANGLWAPGYSSRGPCWPCTVLQASPHSTEVPVELRHLHHHCPKGGKINTPPVLKLFSFFFFHVFFMDFSLIFIVFLCFSLNLLILFDFSSFSLICIDFSVIFIDFYWLLLFFSLFFSDFSSFFIDFSLFL